MEKERGACIRVRTLREIFVYFRNMEESKSELKHERSVRTPSVFLVISYSVLATLIIFAIMAAKRQTGAAGFADVLSPWQGLALVTASVLVVTLFMRKLKARAAWELILGVALFLGAWFYAMLLLPIEWALVAASVLTLLQGTVRRAMIHNVFIIFGAAGTALNLAFSLSDKTLIVILVGLAIYDSFAGRPGGIAAEFAASLVHRGIIPGLIVPGRVRDLLLDIHAAIRRADASLLGAGDLILPMTLVARAAVHGIDRALAVTAGILVAAGWLGGRGPTKPFPALVPLAAGSVIPYLLLVIFGRL